MAEPIDVAHNDPPDPGPPAATEPIDVAHNDPPDPGPPAATVTVDVGLTGELISEDPVGFWPTWLRRSLYVLGLLWAAVFGAIAAHYTAADRELALWLIAHNAAVSALGPLIANSNVRRR
jgi:hypothetical protein